MDPFTMLATRVEHSPTKHSIGTWYRVGRQTEFRFPDAVGSLAVGYRGFIQVGCDGAILIADGSSDFDGVLEVQYPDQATLHVTGEGQLREHGVVHPSGLLVLSGIGEIVAIQTDVTPGPGWSHFQANAWNSASLAVHP